MMSRYLHQESEHTHQSISSEGQETKKWKGLSIIRAKNMIYKALGQTLNRTKVSDRAAVHTIVATDQSLGHNVDKLAIDQKTIDQSRRSY